MRNIGYKLSFLTLIRVNDIKKFKGVIMKR